MPYLTMAEALEVLGVGKPTMLRRIAEGKVTAEARDRAGNVVPWLEVEGRRSAPPRTQWFIEVSDDDIEAHERRRAAMSADSEMAELAAEVARTKTQLMQAMASLERLGHRIESLALRRDCGQREDADRETSTLITP